MSISAMTHHQHLSALLELLGSEPEPAREPSRPLLTLDFVSAASIELQRQCQEKTPLPPHSSFVPDASQFENLPGSFRSIPISPMSPLPPSLAHLSQCRPIDDQAIVPLFEVPEMPLPPPRGTTRTTMALPEAPQPEHGFGSPQKHTRAVSTFCRAGLDSSHAAGPMQCEPCSSPVSNMFDPSIAAAARALSNGTEPAGSTIPSVLLEMYFGGHGDEVVRPVSTTMVRSEPEVTTDTSTEILMGQYKEGRAEINSSPYRGLNAIDPHTGHRNVGQRRRGVKRKPCSVEHGEPVRSFSHFEICESNNAHAHALKDVSPMAGTGATACTEIPDVSECIGQLPQIQMLSSNLEMSRPRVGRGRGGRAGIPSKFCHVCTARTAGGAAAVCAGVPQGTCRKTVCRSCFIRYEESFQWDTVAGRSGHGWDCFHCRSRCPGAAQCKSYERVNEKRRRRLLNLKIAASASGDEEQGNVGSHVNCGGPISCLPPGGEPVEKGNVDGAKNRFHHLEAVMSAQLKCEQPMFG